MSKLTTVIGAAIRDARRAEAMLREPGGRHAISSDPERLLAQFESSIEDLGARQARIEHRPIAVRAARRAASS